MRCAPLVLALIAAAPMARAETAPPPETSFIAEDTGCIPAEAIVSDTLPANAGGLVIRGGVGEITVSLLASDGTTFPTTLVDDPLATGGRILRFDKDLQEEVDYTVKVADGCGVSTRKFAASPSSPLPKDAGSAFVESEQFAFSGTCTAKGDPIGLLSRRIALAPSAELLPFLAVTRVELVVGGASAGVVTGGGKNLFAQNCPAAGATHFATLRVHLPSGATVMTGEFKIDAFCPSSVPEGCSVTEPPKGDAASSADATADDPERAAAYGCAMSGGSTATIQLVVIGAALALVASRRNRRG